MRFDAPQIGHHDVFAFPCDVTLGDVDTERMRRARGRQRLGVRRLWRTVVIKWERPTLGSIIRRLISSDGETNEGLYELVRPVTFAGQLLDIVIWEDVKTKIMKKGIRKGGYFVKDFELV